MIVGLVLTTDGQTVKTYYNTYYGRSEAISHCHSVRGLQMQC